MGFFGKKKQGDTHQSNDDDFSFFDTIEDDSDFSAENYVELGYGDMDNLGLGGADQISDEAVRKANSDEKEEEGVNFTKVIIFITVFVLLGIGAYSLVSNDNSGEPPAQEQQSSEQAGGDAADNGKKTGLVVTEQVGKEFVSNEDGNPVNGTGVILAFDYAYYTKRDGKAARELFNPEAKSYNASYIQREIDKVPQGTTYELSITPQRIGESYVVKLKLNIPGSEPVVYNQKFTTAQRGDGTFYIKQFTSST